MEVKPWDHEASRCDGTPVEVQDAHHCRSPKRKHTRVPRISRKNESGTPAAVNA